MGGVLALVEHRDGNPRVAGLEAMSAAAELAVVLGCEAEAAVLGGPGVEKGARELGRYGAHTVRLAAHPALETYRPEGFAELLAEVVRAGGYEVVILPATTQGKDLAPRLAALLDVPLAQEVTGFVLVDGRLRIDRPVYAGKAVTTIELDASPVLMTLRPGAFEASPSPRDATVAPLQLDIDPERWPSRTISFEAGNREIPDVSEAAIVVSGGRGMRDPENWRLLEELRAALGPEAGLGASRAVVDAGWRPHSEQVGQTGKTVAPRLYFAVGISGAVQHLAGMRTAGTIVAVNRDRDAPIFRVADYGIVGDVFEVIPRLTAEVRAIRER